MNVASLELCKELFGLSGWADFDNWWINVYGEDWKVMDAGPKGLPPDEPGDTYIPAYALGYLLRKLEGFDVSLNYSNQWRKWSCFAHRQRGFEATPENAACKLLIELIKQKVLTK